jgi:hypothetical protein
MINYIDADVTQENIPIQIISSKDIQILASGPDTECSRSCQQTTGTFLKIGSTVTLHTVEELGAGYTEFDFRKRRRFFLLCSIHTVSGAHLVYYPMGSSASFPGVKAAGS